MSSVTDKTTLYKRLGGVFRLLQSWTTSLIG
jgi:hypothetical protein